MPRRLHYHLPLIPTRKKTFSKFPNKIIKRYYYVGLLTLAGAALVGVGMILAGDSFLQRIKKKGILFLNL